MSTNTLQKFTTAAGRCIYTFPVQAFATLVANIYVIDDGERLTLVDTGSGLPDCNQQLQAGFAALTAEYGPRLDLANLDAILVTHGHIDHFGGLPFVRQFSQAPIGVHVLDRRVLSNHQERQVVAARRLENFLEMAGVPAKHREALMSVYLWAKGFYRSIPVDFLLEEGEPAPGNFQVFHAPGHCPGQVCLRVDDMLLTADHILARITPHQAPESITNHMGLGHYLDSLARIEKLPGITLGLGGHEEPITDIYSRIQAIRHSHQSRLEKTWDICREPRSIADVSKELFGHVESYHVLLALEETGAHVEYLYQRGELVAANLDEIEQNTHPVIRYVRA